MTLEDRYRRRLRLFPKAWRADNEEELLAMLLDAAETGRGSVPLLDSADLLGGAIRVRTQGALRSGTLVLGLASLVLGVALMLLRLNGNISTEFLATSLIVVLIPGTGVVYTVSSAVKGGWRRGFFAATGCTCGIVPHLLAATFGLSGVMQAGAVAFEVVRWVGVAYLVFLGVSMIRDGGALSFDDDAEAGDERPLAIIRRGILLNLLNPKLTVFFFAFLPQFLEVSPRTLDPQLILLGLVFMAITLVVFLGYAAASAAVRQRVLESPVALRRVHRALGTLLVGFAARLALTDS